MTVLRRLPVPVTEPYPCTPQPRRVPGPHAPVRQIQGALALAFTAVEDRQRDTDRWAGPQPTSSRDLPDPTATCSALVQAVVEVLAGTRPPAQLVRWLTADVYTALQRRAALAARLQAAPARSGVTRATAAARRPVVTRVRTSTPADGVVEAAAVVLDRGRIRAVAVRLEGMDGRWRATAVEVG